MPDDKLELKPLEEDDDDDEDMTVFDRTNPRTTNSQSVLLKKSAKQFCKCCAVVRQHTDLQYNAIQFSFDTHTLIAVAPILLHR